ncbi:MAG: hypothetical protein AAGA68_14055 [Pseudomonadota bacterium]
MTRASGAERGLAIAATVALLLAVWPTSRPGAGAPSIVGESASEGVQAVSAHLAARGSRAAVQIAAPGLSPERWRDLRLTSVVFDPTELDDQVVALHWPRRIALGEALLVSGRVAVSARAQVVLEDPFGAEAARAVVTADAPSFVLKLTPRATGRYVARLRLEDAQGVSLDAGPIPVTVRAPSPLRILIEASSPTFELQGLRHWASRSGAQLSQRVRIAQERFSSVYVNREEPLAYDDADVLLIDATAWSSQSDAQRQRIAQAVEAGLGLVMLGDDAVNETNWRSESLVLPALGSRWLEDEVLIKHLSDEPLSTLAPTGRRLLADPNVHVLLADDAGEPLASVRDQGQGRVGWLVVTGTHRWVTAGHPEVHARFWRSLLRAVARPRAGATLELPAIAVVDERAMLCVRGAPAAPLTVSAGAQGGAVAVALQQDDLARACGFYWPREAGWQTVAHGAERRSLYVARSTPWRGVAAQRAQDASAQIALASSENVPRAAGPVPRGPFLVAFALLAGALWWRERAGRGAEAAAAA